ncbi:MAG: hypothetical protein AAB592_02195 [Patescibacteria group bacterium]
MASERDIQSGETYDVSGARAAWNDRHTLGTSAATFAMLREQIPDKSAEVARLEALLTSCFHSLNPIVLASVDPNNIVANLTEVLRMVRSLGTETHSHLHGIMDPNGRDRRSLFGTVMGDVITVFTFFHNRLRMLAVHATGERKAEITPTLAAIEEGMIGAMTMIQAAVRESSPVADTSRIEQMIASFRTLQGVRSGYNHLALIGADSANNKRGAIRFVRVDDAAWEILELKSPVKEGDNRTFKEVWELLVGSMIAYQEAESRSVSNGHSTQLLNDILTKADVFVAGLAGMHIKRLQELCDKEVLGTLIGDIYTMLAFVQKRYTAKRNELAGQASGGAVDAELPAVVTKLAAVNALMVRALQVRNRVTPRSARIVDELIPPFAIS